MSRARNPFQEFVPNSQGTIASLHVRNALVVPPSFVDGVTITGTGAPGDPLTTAGAAPSIQELNIAPLAPDPFGVGANMPAGYVNNYTDPSLPTHTMLWWKGADNQGTWVTGIDATGIVAGDVRIFVNLSISGIDVGHVVIKDKSSAEAAGSLVGNRVLCPGRHDCMVPIGAACWVQYLQDELGVPCWIVLGVAASGWAKKNIVQSLQFYPNMQVGTPAVGIVGVNNDFDPPGVTNAAPGEGLATSDLDSKDHTLWRVWTDAAGATVTGLSCSAAADTPQDWGPVKVLHNYGPGVLTIAHLGTSLARNQILCPSARDLVLAVGDTVWIQHPFFSQPASGTAQWIVIGVATSNEVFPSVTTVGRGTFESLTLGPAQAAVALGAGLSSDVNIGSRAVVSMVGTAPYSAVDGMVPSAALVGNEVRILRNAGTVPIVFIPDLTSVSVATNALQLPAPGMSGATTTLAPPYFLPPQQEVIAQYDAAASRWRLCGLSSVNGMLNTGSLITPPVLVGGAENDYSSVDSTSGLPGRFAYIWFVQGAFGTELTGIDATPGRAFLDVLVPSANCNTVVQEATPGAGGNATTLAFVADGAGAGNVDETAYPAIVFHYQTLVTTVANFEAAVAASANLMVRSAGTAAALLTAPGDTFGATNLAGGVSLPAFQVGDRVLVHNLLSGLTVKNFDARSLAVNRFRLTSDMVLSQYGSAEFMYVGSWISVSRST